MNDQPRPSWQHPDFKLNEYDADFSASLRCFTRPDGVHFCPAGVNYFGVWRGTHVLYSMELGQRGLAVALTPDGARSVAANLLRIAEMVEQSLASQVTEQLAAIAKGGAA